LRGRRSAEGARSNLLVVVEIASSLTPFAPRNDGKLFGGNMKKLTALFLLLTLIACGPAAIVTPTASPAPSSTPAPTATSMKIQIENNQEESL